MASKFAEEDSVKTGNSNPELRAVHTQKLSVNCLTIAFHPQLCRIGERFLCSAIEEGKPILLSRTEPVFCAFDRGTKGTLSLSAISRNPLTLLPAPDRAVRILRGNYSASVAVNGRPLGLEMLVRADEIAGGVVLALSERVLLLLHRYEANVIAEMRSRDLANVSGLVGNSPALIQLHADIEAAAKHDRPVLLRGETGSGKELVAAAIHRMSPRKQQAMVSVNMGGLSPTLAKAELFGTEKGSFTGAVKQAGLFRRADQSTLFLDEVGDTPDEVQVMLLRTLETKTVQALGSPHETPVDVRLIAATDADLGNAMRRSRFREPFYHRLAGQVIHVPPLRERRDDIGRLLVHFLVQELTAMGMAQDAIQAVLDDREQSWLTYEHVAPLVPYPWPGNVRELRNRVGQIVLSVRTGHGVELPALLALVTADATRRNAEATNASAAIPEPADASAATPEPAPAEPRRVKKRRRLDLSDERIEEALRVNDWEITAAAAALECSRQCLYDRMKESSRFRTLESMSDAEILAAHEVCGGDIDRLFRYLKVSRPALIRRLGPILKPRP